MRPKSRTNFTIAIICALPLEAEAVEALFDEHYDRLGKYYGKKPGDLNAYINGRIGKHNVVLCYMPGIGKVSTAAVTSSLQASYPGIMLALATGICGGAPLLPEYREIFLGDVIISDLVIEYDFGRQYPDSFQRKTKAKDTLGRPFQEIQALLKGLRAENTFSKLQNQAQHYLYSLQETGTKWCHPGVNDILFRASYLHKHYNYSSPAGCSCFGSDLPEQICEEAFQKDCDDIGCDQGEQIRCRKVSKDIQTSIHIGPIASSDTIIKFGQHREEIVRKEKVIGFDVEGAWIWDNVPCIIIKGVCDYADSHKSMLWQAYAAATGASVTKAFLDYWMPANHQEPSNHRLLIPFARNPHFVGRQEEIQRLENLISVPDRAKNLAITGLGGIGKTQIALELAYRMRDREPDCSIFWISCTSYEAVEQAFMTIAQMVGLQGVEPTEVKECLRTYFNQTNKKWFLVFDNADDMDMWIQGSPTALPLMDIIPRSGNGHVLFTSRNRKLAVRLASPNVLSVPDVDQQTAKEIFKQQLIWDNLFQDDHVIITLLEQLAFLPLAISQSTAFINQNRVALDTYMSLLDEGEKSTIELLSEDFRDNGRYAEIQNPVATTWLISFLQIQQVDKLAIDYLSFMACISPRDIPESILPPTLSAKRMVEALGLLKSYSFISAQVNNSILSLHRLVHLATRNWLRNEDTLKSWVKTAAGQLNKIFPSNYHSNRQMWRDYLPHALYLVDSEEFQDYQDEYGDFLERVGSCLKSDGRYLESETLFRNVLEIRERVCGPDHPDTLTSGKYKEAEAMHQRALQGRENIFGPDNPDTLSSISHISFRPCS
ncbi:putative kinesin light chain [Aspergillus californicus]